MSLYTESESHYFRTTKAGEIDRAHRPRSAGRSSNLGVEHIGAYSPQARGRWEGAFETLQDRLPKELRLAGITDVEAANAFIREIYLPEHNARFAVRSGRRGLGVHPHSRRRSRRDPVRARGAAGQKRQLSLLPDAETADPRKPDAAPFRQGEGQGPRLPRRLARRISWNQMHRTLRENGALKERHDEKRAA